MQKRRRMKNLVVIEEASPAVVDEGLRFHLIPSLHLSLLEAQLS